MHESIQGRPCSPEDHGLGMASGGLLAALLISIVRSAALRTFQAKMDFVSVVL